MSESTVNFGLDVTTGNSTTSVDNLTTSVDGLLAKYTALMEEMGKGDQVFAKVVKALGGHKGELDAAAREIDKVQKAMSGGTAKAMTSDLGSEFKTLAQDLKTAFSGIPVEIKQTATVITSVLDNMKLSISEISPGIKTATTQITGMAESMQNQLGKVTVLLDDIKQGFKQAGAASETFEEKKPKVTGTKTTKKSKAETLAMLGISVTSLEQIQQDLKKYAHEFSANFVEDRSLNALKTRANELMTLKEKASIVGGTSEAVAARTLIGTLNQEIQRREKLIELAHKEEAANKWKTFRQDAQKHDEGVTWATKAKTDSSEWDALVLAETTAKQSAEAYGVTVKQNLQAKKESQALAEKEAVQQKKLNDDIREYTLATEAAYAEKKRQDKELYAIREEGFRAFDRSEVAKKQKASEYFKLTSSWLKQQIAEREQADKKEAIAAKMLSETKLKMAAQGRTQTYTNEYEKAGSDLVALDVLSKKITNELIANRKNLGTITKSVSKETIQALKEEISNREALLRTIKEEEVIQRVGIGKLDKGAATQVRDLIYVLAKAEDATRTFGKTSQDTIFENIEDMRSYKEQISAVREGLTKELSRKGLNTEIREAIGAQIKELDMAQEAITKYLGRGINVRGTAQVANPEAIRLKEEIDLLNKYQDITDRVRQAKEKLNQTKGSKSDTLQARKEMEALRLEQEKLKDEMQGTAALFSAAGMTGSKAMRDITNASTKLNNEMASLKGTISTTESSFKNMWGQASMALGKMMLWYHSISVGVSLIKNSFTGIVSMFDSIMKGGESITSIQKTLNVLNNGDIRETRKDYERLRQIVYAYGQDLDAVSSSYVKWAGITKESGADAESMWRVYEKIIASSRGLGIKQAEMGDYMKAFEQILSKGRVGAEEFNQQLAEKVTNLYGGIKKALADIRGVSVKTIDLQSEMKKGTFKVSEFLSAFDQYSNKWAAAGNTLADAYSAAVGRLNMAWKEFLVSLSEGAVGSKIRGMIEDLTVRLKDPDTVSAMSGVVTSLTEVSQILYNIATIIIPKIGAAVRKIPFVGYDEAVANKKDNELLKAGVAQVYVKDPAYFNTAFENKAQRAEESNPLVEKFFQMKQATGIQSIDVTAAARKANAMDDSMVDKVVTDIAELNLLPLVEKGFLQVGEDGTLIPADSAKSAAEHMAKITQSNIQDLIIMPYLKTLESFGGIDAVNEFKTKIMASAEAAKLQFSGEATKLAMEGNTPSNAKEIMRDLGVGTSMLQGDKVLKINPDMFTKLDSTTKTGDTDAKVKAFSKSLENIQDQINKASMGKWAYEFAQVTHKLKEFEIELGDKAAPQIAELGKALRKEFGENFTRGLDEFDTSLDMAIRSGKYGKELQTSFDAVTKTYKDNLKKIEDDYKGISLSEVTQAELDKVAQLKTKAEQAKVAGYDAAIEAAMVSEKMISKAQIQGAEKTIQEVMAIRNDETKDVVELEKQLVSEVDRLSQEGYNRKVANIEKATEAEIKQGVAAVDAFKWQERKKQDELDKSLELRIASTENFTDYLNTRFAKEQGFFDNPTVATTKQFEKMYDVIGSGAAEIGQTIQESFTEAFTGTLKSWTDVWKSIQATFLKGLAEMIWVAKMRPIQLSLVSAFTGMGTSTALAGGSTAGQVASQAHDMVTGGSQANSEGFFSKMSNSMDKMTKSFNEFGKETLGLSTDLTHAIAGGGLGLAIGSMMFPDNVTAKIGAAIGGAAGEVIGETYGGPIGGAIGSAAGSVIGGAIGKFFTGEKKVTDYGIRVSVDDEGLKFLDKYEKIKKSSSFNLSAVFKPSFYTDPGSAWSVGNKKERYSDVDPQVYKQISAAITTSFSTVSRQMLSLGLAPNFAGFSIDEKVSLKGKDPEALLQAWLNKLSGKMVDTALANDSVQASFAAAKKMGETSSDALTRLVDAMTALESGAIKANVSIDALAGGLSGIDLASFASDFSEALGGSSNVSAFFDQISEFIGYVGIQGISNMTKFQEKFETAIGNINSYTGMSGSRTSTLLGQQTELGLTQSFIENKLEKFAAGAGWSKWLTFQDGELTMRPGSKYSTVEEMAAADPKWKAVLDPMIAYVKELKVTNQALENVAIKIDREATTAPSEAINASSATFWTDYTKALQKAQETGGMPPELASAWFAAGQVAEAMKEQRESAIAAKEEIEKQTVAYNEQRKTLQLSAQYFGASANGLIAISREAEVLNQNDLSTWFEESKNAVVDGLVPGLMAFNRTGETALDTLIRLTNVFKTTEQAAALAGTNLVNLSGGLTGLGAANYAQGLADYFGDADIVSGIFQNISDAIYTDDESKDIAKAYWKNQAEAQAAALGTDLTGAKDWIKNQLANPLSAEQIQNINILATSINNLEDASGTSADAIDDLADYMQDLTDKILTMGMTDTQEFIFNLKKEVKDMYDTILDKNGTEEQAQLAYKYQSAAIRQRLDETMKDINLSIRKLVSPELIEQINQLSDSYWEQVQSATLLGATQEELNAILYNSYLQAKQVLASAANAYIAAYDSSVSKIEELKNKQQALEDDVDSARSDYMASLKKEIDLKQEAIDKIQENVDNLKDFITSLKELKTELATSAGFLNPQEKAGVSLSEFYKTANLAAKGDTTAMGNVSSQAQAALSASEAGSYEDYIKTFASIYATASGLETSAQAQLDPQQLQLDALIASRDSLQTIYDSLEKLNDKTLAIDTARTAYETAQAALANSTYQAQIDTAQAEVDRHKETVELLRAQYTNDLTLAAAANNFFTIKGIIEKAVPNQDAIAADSKAIKEAIKAQNNDFKELLSILDPDPTTDGTDTGIKTIVAAASVRDGVLLALREANTLETVNTTSVIGLLNSIKSNTTPEPPAP